MAISINGYNLSDSSGLVLGASTSKIDSSGRVIVPNLPIVFGSKVGSTASANQYPWQLNSTAINVNTCWNGTVFTCPVAGIYYTSWTGICEGGNSSTAATALSGYGGLVKNGVLQGFFYWSTNDYWDTLNYPRLISCAAGDTLSWAINIAPSFVGNSPGAYGDNHNMSTIWLIG